MPFPSWHLQLGSLTTTLLLPQTDKHCHSRSLDLRMVMSLLNYNNELISALNLVTYKEYLGPESRTAPTFSRSLRVRPRGPIHQPRAAVIRLSLAFSPHDHDSLHSCCFEYHLATPSPPNQSLSPTHRFDQSANKLFQSLPIHCAGHWFRILLTIVYTSTQPAAAEMKHAGHCFPNEDSLPC